MLPSPAGAASQHFEHWQNWREQMVFAQTTNQGFLRKFLRKCHRGIPPDAGARTLPRVCMSHLLAKKDKQWGCHAIEDESVDAPVLLQQRSLTRKLELRWGGK